MQPHHTGQSTRPSIERQQRNRAPVIDLGQPRDEGVADIPDQTEQTRDAARFIGLSDRGTIEPGQRADVNVVDLSRLSLRRPTMQRDLPAGGQRLVQRADGYLATLVAGELVAANGELTGARPGRLVRL
jgi:N-acyl-D-aspartate/D-glutamate deacylase